jgi:Fe-S-cluster-containing dehydrogenase component
MGYVLLVDVSKCHGCYNCYVFCKDEHVGNDWSPYSKPQPVTNHFWMKVDEIERGTIPKVKIHYLPQPCMHCDNPPCIPACSLKAINKRADGIVLIDPEKCNGCGDCIKACPYHAIYFNSELSLAQKCTFCAHLLEDGWKEPRCVETCIAGALTFGDYEDLKNTLQEKNASPLHPEYDTQPRVYYIGIPKKFIAGAIVDQKTDDCMEDAKVTLKNLDTGKTDTTKSDNYGDFWVEGLEQNGLYSLKIEKPGYHSHILSPISTKKDVNLGDIFLFSER